MGIDWWEGDPFLSRSSDKSLDSRLKRLEEASGLGDGERREPERGQ